MICTPEERKKCKELVKKEVPVKVGVWVGSGFRFSQLCSGQKPCLTRLKRAEALGIFHPCAILYRYGVYQPSPWTLGLSCSEVKAGIQNKKECFSKMLTR